MWIGSRLTNYPMTGKIIYQYVLEILPLLGPVIQVLAAHYLYKLMWERPTEFCILPVKSESVVVSCHLWVCVPGRRGGRKRRGPELHFTWHKHVTRCLPVDLLPFAVGKSRVYYMTPNKSSVCTPLWSPASVDGPEHWNMNEWGKGRSAGFPPAGSDRSGPSSWPSPPACPPLGTLSPTFQAVARQGRGALGQAVSVWSSLSMETGFARPSKRGRRWSKGAGQRKKQGGGREEEVVEPNQENFLRKGK